ncbi:type III secretion inner membrane ring lipoprotein SctJ [Belnapia sp. T18]|uniref:Lipoprotein n=1 Tax=Belnapia arida TaxID=2804533 RepID=A0ABS1U5W0_9PROT|nr:type III secretion inner membrane ring lipoprotein SctJ [Belnapia arida]MBL6080038.1 type III secretion inner membrane ring lipoprotein SctJ [Belnapia arida]
MRRNPLALLLALMLALGGCGKVELYGTLPEREANDMLALLLRAGISAEKATGRGGISLRVESGRVSDAVDLLNVAGLPRDRYANIGDLFRKEGLISSPAEERVRYMYGITQELSRTLSGIDGVLSARVHVVLPNNDPSAGIARPSSAAVMIRYAPSTAVEVLVPRIKELVVNSIEGLSYERVSVVLVRAVPDDAPSRIPVFPVAATLPPFLLYGIGGALAAALLGNVALAALLLRRRAHAAKVPTVPALT